MKELYEMYASLGVSREVYEFGQSVLDSLKARFEGCLLYTSEASDDQ